MAGVALGGCTFDPGPAAPEDATFIDDSGPEATVSVPEPTALVNGTDMPASLECLGKTRDAGTIHEASAPDTASTDTASTDTASTDAAEDVASDGGLDVGLDVGLGVDALDDTTVADDASDAAAAADVGDATLGDSVAESGSDAAIDTMSSPDADLTVGTLHDETVELIAFGTGGVDKLPGAVLDVFWSDTFTKPADVTGIVADAKGLMRVTVPYKTRIGYHVRATSELLDFYVLDDLREVVVGDPYPRWQAITKTKFQDLTLAVTGSRDYVLPPKTAIVTARVVDCARQPLRYTSIHLIDMTDGTKVDMPFGKCGTDMCLLYLSDLELPDLGATYTSRSGLVVMVQVPTGRKLRVVAEGYHSGNELYEVGHRDLEVQEGAINNFFIEPDNN